MSNSYQLKSHPDKLLYHHLRSVASTTKSIVEKIFPKIISDISLTDFAETAFVTGATHDIGKGTTFFQDYLLGHMKLDPLLKSHSMISSLYCSWCILDNEKISDNHRDLLAVASALAIQGHHGSLKRPTSYLINGLNVFDNEEIFTRQIKAFQNIDEIEKISQSLGLRSFIEFTKNWDPHFFEFSKILIKSSSFIQKKFPDLREPYFIIKLLYSSLLDADRMDAAGLESDRTEIRPGMVADFVRELNSHPLSPNVYTVNKFRNILFDSIQQESVTVDLDCRLFTLTAPTGLGKTLASLNFAQRLRERIRQRNGFSPRIIYVAPFISILDQNMKVLQDVFSQQLQQSNFLLMHHHLAPINYTKSTIDEQKKESYSTSQSELLIQGWNSEIIITTFLQFFNTIFGRFTSQLRRLHNLLGGIIILDEVQSIPFEYWNAVRNALLFLSEKFGFTIIMMTATQPLIFAESETKELAPIDLLRNLPQRVVFHTRNQQPIRIDEFCMDINNLLNENKTKSVLIELNTISNANHIFRSITTSDNLFFLSSQVIPKHRRPRIDQIKDSLQRREPVVLVSTQVIEAGVDLDFDIAVRDIGPIDSIVQTSGRCNRNGERKATDSPFFIYRIVDDNNHDYAKRIYGRVSIDISNTLLSSNSDILTLVESYYEEVRRRRSSQPSDDINTAISELDYEKVDDSFKLIDQEFKVPVFVEFDEDAIKIWNRFVETSQPEARRQSRNEIIQQRHEMEQYMIGISELDVLRFNLSETAGVYKINQADIGILYDEITGFAIR